MYEQVKTDIEKVFEILDNHIDRGEVHTELLMQLEEVSSALSEAYNIVLDTIDTLNNTLNI